MKEKPTGRASAAKAATDWQRLRKRSDREIRRGIESDPETKPTDREFWSTARVVMPRRKQSVTIRLDADLLDWLRAHRGYQTRINAVLRAYMQAQGRKKRSGSQPF